MRPGSSRSSCSSPARPSSPTCSRRSRPWRTRRASSGSTAVRRLPREPRETTLALWRIGDPGNVGTLLRAADAFGAAVALSEGCADPLGSKALRASAGAIFRVPLLAFDDAPGTRVSLVAHGAPPLQELELSGADDVPARRGARRAPARARRCERPCRHDPDERRSRVAQRRRRRGDRALRALAQLAGRAGEEPADGGFRGGRRDLVVAAEAAVGDRVAGPAELADDRVSRLPDRKDAVERSV